MIGKRRGIPSRWHNKWRGCIAFALILAVFCTLAMTAYAEKENETVVTKLADDGTENGSVVNSTDSELEPVSASIIFYKTTTGGGNFTSKAFRFRVVRVSDKNGNPWTGADETVISNNGIITVSAGPNMSTVSATFSIQNLTAPKEDQASYYYKISEITDPESGWSYDDREFVIRIIVFDFNGSLLVPGQGMEWFCNGQSYDLKGGGSPIPPNEFNTFINEYSGADGTAGRLRVKKNDFNETPPNPDEVFEFQLSKNGVPVDLSASDITIRKVSGKGSYAGTDLKNGKFTLKFDTEIQISGLPAGAYSITELVAGYVIRYVVDGGPSTSGSTANVTINEGAEASVVFTNTGTGSNTRLTIRKRLSGDYASWGADENTVFHAKILDSRGRYLTFNGTAPNYTMSGISAAGSEIRFSARQPAVISGIPAGVVGTVVEIIPDGAHYTASYSGNNFTISDGANGGAEVTVTNTYEDHGVGNLTITKRLAGSYDDWSVDENTVFNAKIKDITNAGNVYYLDFKHLPNGNYEAVAIGTGNPTIQFSAGKPVVLSLLWDNRVYEVEEASGVSYTVSYSGNGVRLPEGGNMNVTVINTFKHGEGNLVISKRLAGNPGDWGVDESTVFTARLRDMTDNNYVFFELQADGTYLAVGNSDSGTPSNDKRELVRFSAGSTAITHGLWSSHTYKVEETGGLHYTASYSGNSSTLPEGGNLNVTITNTFEHGIGNIVIGKALEGFPGDWNVDEDTVFLARVKDVTDGNYVLFQLQPNGTYQAFANSGSSTPTQDARELVRFTASSPAVLTGLWANQEYAVEEVSGLHYTATYHGEGSMAPQKMPEDGNISVTITNTYEPSGGDNGGGGDTGRLKVAKANFIKTPAKPHEAFSFVVRRDGKPVDLTAGKINIRKTGGSGVYRATNLRNGGFTLTYDTEVTIDGLPLGVYTVAEYATGYIISTEVINKSGTGSNAVDLSVIFTNEEAGPGDDEPDDNVEIEVPLIPRDEMPTDDRDNGGGTTVPTTTSPGGGAPRTGDDKPDNILLFLLAAAFIGTGVALYFRQKARNNKKEE